jgi:hypothetical protein
MVGENGRVGGELIVRVVINFFFLLIVLCLCLTTKGICECPGRISSYWVLDCAGGRTGQWCCCLLGWEASLKLKGSMVVFAFEL